MICLKKYELSDLFKDLINKIEEKKDQNLDAELEFRENLKRKLIKKQKRDYI